MAIPVSALMLCIFCIGTAELVVTGLLPQLAVDLHVSVPSAGLLVTLYAAGAVVGGPVVTALTTRVPRKALLLALMGLFAAGNVIAFVAPSYAWLAVGRVLSALSQGTFFAVSVIVALTLVAPEKAGVTIANLAFGLNLATVLGSPLGTLLGQHLGWRAVFGVIAVASVLCVVALGRTAPAVPADGGSVRAEFAVFRNAAVWQSILITTLAQAGLFAVMTYIAPLVTGVSGFPVSWVSVLLLVFGAGSALGNFAGGRLADRWLLGSLVALLTELTLSLLLLWLVLPWRVLTPPVLLLFGAFGFSIVPGLQARIMRSTTGAPTLALSVNVSAFNIGNGLGAWLGGQDIALGLPVRSVTIVGAVLSAGGLAALALVWARERRTAGKVSV
ncbi:MFS transporter [Amycolatopsis cynarae]|uniref:MFS transporter n=1 Tax=Amycolatopsis cynarae TaxID=2995223 RepID=A0ABY7B1V4_9PSEU|nr:MFS transporter [Amycolatopsis sp. HUAS 11-8]WAL65922.1 MFS transporter [Amycolatopsis sp. HUAS 11-8]